MHDIPGAIERSLEQSLKRLQPRRVALFQLHNQLGAAVGDRPRPDAGAGAGTRRRRRHLRPAQGAGAVLACGITAAGDTAAILEVINSGRFDCAQVYYNAINPSAGWSRAAAGTGGRRISPGDRGVLPPEHGRAQYPGLGRRRAGQARRRPERLSVMTSGTDLDNEMRCARRRARGARRRHMARRRRRRCASCSATTTSPPASSASPNMRELDEAIEAVERGAVADGGGRQARTAVGHGFHSSDG